MTDIAQWNVILVDDEPDSLNLLCDILTLQGAQVHRAASGKQCLALLETITPTLVVVDLAMPKPDGWDVLASIRAAPATARVPVIAITAYYSNRVVERARQVGFNALIPKPIKAEQFLSKLKEVVG
jgi:two-component system sensor histidine kinase/response regulator